MASSHNMPKISKDFALAVKDWQHLEVAELQSVCETTFEDLLRSSPVFTGQYRASHLFALNEPIKWRAPRLKTADKMMSFVEQNRAKMKERVARLANVGLAKTIYFLNWTRQAVFIERGTASKKAPGGVYRQVGARLMHRLNKVTPDTLDYQI